jgi:SAM-dependent methyltransferase
MTRPNETFDRVAVLYDRARPRYPAQLFADVMEQAQLAERARLLEIGAGTGQATQPFAAGGFEILCLEPGEQLARLAASNLRDFPGVRVVAESFEQASLPLHYYDLVFAAQAFHWVPKEVALSKTAAVLKAGGTVALFWSSPLDDKSELRARLDEAYQRHAPAMRKWAQRPDPGYRMYDIEAALEASSEFEDVRKHTYGWKQSYTTAQYLELMQTHSDHQLMSETDRQALLGDIARVIDEAGSTYTLEYETRLFCARRLP